MARAWFLVAVVVGQVVCGVAHDVHHHHHVERPREQEEEFIITSLILGLALSGTGIGTSLWQTSEEDSGAQQTLKFLKSVYCPLSEIGAQLHAARATAPGFDGTLEIERAANFLTFRNGWCREFSPVVLPHDLQEALAQRVLEKAQGEAQSAVQNAVLSATHLTGAASGGVLSTVTQVKPVADILGNLYNIHSTKKMTWLQWVLLDSAWGTARTFRYEFDTATQKGRNTKLAGDELWLQFGYWAGDVGRAAKPLRALFRDFHHARHFSKAVLTDAVEHWLPAAVAQAQAVVPESEEDALAIQLREEKLVPLWPYWELLRPHVKKEMPARDPLAVGAKPGTEVRHVEERRARLKLILTPEFEICDLWADVFCGCDNDPWLGPIRTSCERAVQYWNARKPTAMQARKVFAGGVGEELTGALLRPTRGSPPPQCQAPLARVRVVDYGARELRHRINAFRWDTCKPHAVFYCDHPTQSVCNALLRHEV